VSQVLKELKGIVGHGSYLGEAVCIPKKLAGTTVPKEVVTINVPIEEAA
jgi:hypothetical protein